MPPDAATPTNVQAMTLSFTFIGNACGIFTGSQGTRIACDPWLVDGVFEGSWCHYPPLTTKLEDLADIDALFVSHIHPDHFDDRNFAFRRDLPIFVLQREQNFLKRRLDAMGYTNVVEAPDGETVEFNEFHLTLFKPFTTHNFHDAAVGNVIDSALVIECDGYSALNANDNTPTPEACAMLRERFGSLDLAMINYNAAGPYPACFDNLTPDEKLSEHHRILNRNMTYMLDLLQVLEPRACLPFAGAYVLGGAKRDKNPYLGTTTWDACAEFLREHNAPCAVVTLREGDTLDLETLHADHAYVPVDLDDCARYIDDELATLIYDYERDPEPDPTTLWSDIETAGAKMLERSARFDLATSFTVTVNTGGQEHQVLPHFAAAATPSARHLSCSLDSRLMRRILDRKATWNSAEIGCHIDFVRTPNDYEPDLHTMLQFLHL